MSLQEELKRYEIVKRQRQKDLASIKQQIQMNIEEESKHALKIQNHKVNQIHKNQQQIQSKFKRQQELIVEMKKNQEKWVAMYDQINRALMLAGDLVHYSSYIQAQINEILGQGTVADFLEKAEKEQQDLMIENLRKKRTKQQNTQKQKVKNDKFSQNNL